MYMRGWVAELYDFAKKYGKDILQHSGTVSHSTALEKANAEYEKYCERTVNELSPIERDFIKSIKETQNKLKDKHSKKGE